MTSSTAILESSRPTPILDRTAPLPWKNKAQWWQLLIGAAIGAAAVLGAWYARRLTAKSPHSHAPSGHLLLPVVEVALLAYFAIVLHEGGHFVAGRLSGLHMRFMRVGPVQINIPFRVSFHWKNLTEAGGVISMLPKTGEISSRQLLTLLAGGPVANLLSAGVVFSIFKAGGNLPLLVWYFVAISVGLGVVNLIPLPGLFSMSDGTRMLMIIRQKGSAERLVAIFQLFATLVQGKDFEDLPEQLLARATAFKDRSPDTVSAFAIAYYAAFSRHEDDRAAQLLETCLEYSRFTLRSVRDALVSDAAVFQALRRKRVDLAQQWLADLPHNAKFPGLRTRAEAAILEAQGNTEAAVSKLEETETALLRWPNALQRELSLRGLRKWKSELESRAAANI